MKFLHFRIQTSRRFSSFFGRMKMAFSLLILILSLAGCSENGKNDDTSLIGLLGLDKNSGMGPGTGSGPDTQNPIIQSTIPFNNAALVALNSSISIRFSEIIDSSSVTVNTNDNTCSGTVRVSKDNFASCIPLNAPVSNDGNRTFIFTPVSPLESVVQYTISVTTGVTDLAGLPLNVLQTYKFQTISSDPKTFQVTFPSKIFRSSLLAQPDNYSISVTINPTASTRVIRDIVMGFEYRSSTGARTSVKYLNLNNLDKEYFSDVAGAKTISLRVKDFTPSLENLSTWNAQAKLNIGISLVYNDGTPANNVSDANAVEILLENDGPSFDAFAYGIFLFPDSVFLDDNGDPAFVPTGSELPLNQWKSWLEVTSSDGQVTRTTPNDAASSIFLSPVYRPKTGPHETVKFLIDSNGDNSADYIWSVPNFSIGGGGDSLFLFPVGVVQNGVNTPVPFQCGVDVTCE